MDNVDFVGWLVLGRETSVADDKEGFMHRLVRDNVRVCVGECVREECVSVFVVDLLIVVVVGCR